MQNSKSGILAFECSQDNWEPNVVHFWERYDGNRSMGQHNTTDEYSAFMNGVSRQQNKAKEKPTSCMIVAAVYRDRPGASSMHWIQ